MATLSARGNRGEYKARCSSARTTFDLTTSLGVSGSVRRWMAVHLSTCCTQHHHGLHLQGGNEIQHDIECRHIRRQHLRRRQAWNIQPRGRVMEIQIPRSRPPCGAPPVVCFSRGCACMQPAAAADLHDAPLSDKMDGLYGPHTFTPLTARGRARRVRRGEGELHGRAPGEREGERERPAEQCWLLMNRSDFITPRLLHGHGYS